MVARRLRPLALGLVWLVVIGLVGPLPVRALPPTQATPLTQIARTQDGSLSVRLPQGYVAQDSTGAIYSSALVFGDSPETLPEDIFEALSGGPNNDGQPRVGGSISLVDTRITSTMTPDEALNNLFQGDLMSQSQIGGQAGEPETLLLGGGYSARVVVIENRVRNAAGFVAVFPTDLGFVSVMVGMSPWRNFEASRPLLLDILDSIRVPGEAAANLPTPSAPKPVSGTASIQLPGSWAAQQVTVQGFSQLTVFGDSQPNLQAILGQIVEGPPIGAFQGCAGILGLMDLSQVGGAAPATLVDPLMQQLIASTQSEAVQILTPPEAHTFGGLYAGQLAVINLGYLGVFASGDQVGMVMLLTDDLEANQAQLAGLLETIRLAGEASSVPAGQAGFGDLLGGGAAANLPSYRNPEGLLSFALPEGWVTLDFLAAQRILAFGDSTAAATSRLASARADLAAALPLSGQGGLITLYAMAELGIDPAAPDLVPLMAQVIAGAQGQGFQVIEAAQPLPGVGTSGQIALIMSSEEGYVVLAAFGEQVAYVTATCMPADFAASRDLLRQIVASVRIPAEDSAAAQGGGLGGLLPPASGS